MISTLEAINIVMAIGMSFLMIGGLFGFFIGLYLGVIDVRKVLDKYRMKYKWDKDIERDCANSDESYYRKKRLFERRIPKLDREDEK